MKNYFYRLAGLAGLLPLRILMKLTQQNLIFPFYHLVSDSEVSHIRNLYPIRSKRQFESDIDFFITEYGATDILPVLNDIIRGNNSGKKGFILSFDDGLREVYEIAAPILLKKGIRAICFVNSGFIDNPDMFFRYKASLLVEQLRIKQLSPKTIAAIEKLATTNSLQYDREGRFLLSIGYHKRNLLEDFAVLLDIDFKDYLKSEQPYLTSDQIKWLKNKGFIIGSHSIDHPLFTDISFREQVLQVRNSMNDIHNKFADAYRLFSFPFTDDGLSRSLFNEIFNPDSPIADLTFGCAGLKHDTDFRNIQRIPIETGNFAARNIIYGEYLYYLLKGMVHKNTIRRK